MDFIKLDGVPPYDGRYEFNLKAQPLSTREWGWIKRHSGWMPLTIEEGYDGGDPELYATFATIAILRAGKIDASDVPAIYERIADAPFGQTITMQRERDEDDEEEEEDGPPQQSSNGNDATSGTDSSKSSDRSDTSLPRIGTPDSASSPSAQAMSAT